MLTNYMTKEMVEIRNSQIEDVGREITALRESIKGKTGFDPETSVDWRSHKFSFKKLRDGAVNELKESGASSSLGQLFRYGIQHFMFDAYKSVPVVYPDIVQVRPSGNRQEWYAPLYGAEIPDVVVRGEAFKDSRVEGLDTTLINKKIGRIVSFDREMFDDDQTGQIVQRAAKMGERVRYKEETDVMAAIAGATYTVAIGNRPAAYAPLSQLTLEAADIALMGMKDPLGNSMLVMPSLLLVASDNKFNGAKLLNSTLQPSVPGAAGQTASSASSGGTGWTMTINPLQGLYQLCVSRFLTALQWYLMEPRTSIPFQERDALEIVQENPLSGDSFLMDIYRWRVRRRYQTAVIESRYIYCGKQ